MNQSKVQGPRSKVARHHHVVSATLLLLALVAMVLQGCAKPASSASSTPVGKGSAETIAPKQSQDQTPAPAKSSIDIQIRSWDETQKLVASHKGKVVVLDVWSTWCEPCVREFPRLVKLSNDFQGRAACISFNVDYDGSAADPPESHRESVLKFLTEQKAEFDNVISSDPNEDFFNRIKLGGPPAVFVYDREGKLVRRFDNSIPKQPEFTYEKDVVPLVEKLLAGP